MSSILARALGMIEEAAIEERSAQQDHAGARLEQLGGRRDATKEVLEEVAETRKELERDQVELEGKGDAKLLGWCGQSKADKMRRLTEDQQENQAVATEAAQKVNLVHTDQQEVFEDVKKASDRVSTTVGYIQETLRAAKKAEEKGERT